MVRVTVLGMFVLANAGCVSLSNKAVPVYVTSSRQFPPADRPKVWGRALTAFQLRGLLIATSDPIGGVLRSELQPGWVECHGLAPIASGFPADPACKTREQSQLTVGPDGAAFLRVNRVVFGLTQAEASPLTPDDEKVIQGQCDAFLDFIVGATDEPPKPLPPAPEGIDM